MKRITFFLMLASLCVASQAQVNPKMSALFDQLTELGAYHEVVKFRSPHLPAHLTYRTNLYMYEVMPDEEKGRVKRQLAAVRQTLDQLQEVAQESYHYEVHKNGKDTIIYSMNLCADTTDVVKHQNGNHTTFRSNECLNFCYTPWMGGSDMDGMLEYTVTLPDEDKEAVAPYPLTALIDDMARLFKQHNIKPRKSYWQHDREYADSLEKARSNDYVIKINFYNGRKDGDTEATVYTLPEEQKELANQLLVEVSALAQKVAGTPQDFYYRYDDRKSFGKYYWGNVLWCWEPLDSTDPKSYTISAIWDDYGLHFVLAQSRGNFWVPLDWYAVKKSVNGKKTYFKGLEPKKEKKDKK